MTRENLAGVDLGRRALLLLGSFSFGYNGATLLHEVGHVVGALTGGGIVRSLSLHPLVTSAVAVAPDPHPIWTTASGLIFGPLLGILGGVLLARGRPSAWLLPFAALAALCPITTGADLFAGSLLGFGDAAVLLQGGVPRAVLLCAGGLLLAAGAWLAQGAIRIVGISREMSLVARSCLLLGGVGPYLLAIALWNASRGPSAAAPWLALVAIGFAYLVLIASVGARSAIQEVEAVRPSNVAFALTLGAVAFGAMWAAS